MNEEYLVLGVIALYFVSVFGVGALASRGQQATREEYVAGNRSLGLVVMYFLMGGAVFSAFAFLGGPGWAYSKGAASFYILAYSALGILPWWLWAPRTWMAGKKFGYVTQAQLIRGRFNSRLLSVMVAIVTILAFVQYVTVQMKASGYILELASNGLIPFWAGSLIAYIVVVLYVFLGGLRSVAWTNVFQGAFMIITAWVLGLYFVYALYDGPADMFQRIAEEVPSHLLIGPGSSMGYGEYSSIMIISILGFTMWPHLFMKAYAARSPKTLKQMIVIYPTFSIFLVPVLFIGFAGVLQVSPIELGDVDRILPWMFTNAGFHPLAIGLVLAAALAAAMSTQDTVTHAAGSVFVEDIVKASSRKHDSENPESAAHDRTLIRLAVVLFGFASYMIAIVGGQTLVSLLVGAYGSIVQIFPLIAATFFWRRATAAGATAGFIVGTIIYYGMVFGFVPGFYDLHPGLVGLVINIVIIFVVSILTKPMDCAHVSQFINILEHDESSINSNRNHR
ncbi:MAG: sodium:solute symporter family protein [Haliea sp.]